MKAEIINIGDELLMGQVINTNAAWIGEQLNLSGIRVIRTDIIPDRHEQILEILKESGKRADLVIITGGLGPTKDDITKNTLCEYFNTRLVFHQATYDDVEQRFRIRGIKLSKINKEQAEIPESCIPIRNLNGTAPGMWFEQDGCIFVSIPGVPYELKPMLTGFIIPRLARQFKLPVIIHKTILTQGMGESAIAVLVADWENALPENIKIAYLPQPGIVRLRLSATGTDYETVKHEIEKQIEALINIIPDLVFGYDDELLEEIVGKLLKQQGKTLATAESCTGGYIAHLITSIPGSSAYFKGSVVAYANEIKENILNVRKETMLEHGAVSEEAVKAMAAGVKEKFDTDYAIAVSGIAGPDGGSDEKPVGITWIAIATSGKVSAQRFQFGEHRGRNIRIAGLTALNMLRKTLISEH